MPRKPSQSAPFYPQDRMAVFIDGSNLYAASRALDFDIDYSRLLEWAGKQGRLVRAFYYTALLEDQELLAAIRPLVDWLDYNGYTIVTKPDQGVHRRAWVAARSRAALILSWPWTSWKWPRRWITSWCSSPVMVIFSSPGRSRAA
jgi:uncharacterized LabA/DUF88 family protein